MKHRTTPALLVVVALLLAHNLAAQLPWPTAQAQLQPEMAMQPPPRLVGMAVTNLVVHRMWSDGVVEHRTLSHPYWWNPATPEWLEVVPQP